MVMTRLGDARTRLDVAMSKVSGVMIRFSTIITS